VELNTVIQFTKMVHTCDTEHFIFEVLEYSSLGADTLMIEVNTSLHSCDETLMNSTDQRRKFQQIHTFQEHDLIIFRLLVAKKLEETHYCQHITNVLNISIIDL
jgi:hypothetical protein